MSNYFFIDVFVYSPLILLLSLAISTRLALIFLFKVILIIVFFDLFAEIQIVKPIVILLLLFLTSPRAREPCRLETNITCNLWNDGNRLFKCAGKWLIYVYVTHLFLVQV